MAGIKQSIREIYSLGVLIDLEEFKEALREQGIEPPTTRSKGASDYNKHTSGIIQEGREIPSVEDSHS